MKLTIAGVAALAAAKNVYANVCTDNCGEFCEDENDQGLQNFNQAGFDDVAECEAHACTVTFPEGGQDWHTCEIGSRELDGRKYNHVVKMAYRLMTTDNSMKSVHKMLQNYGCHCFPGSSKSTIGHGPAVDAQDSLCRDLARCRRCITMEYGKEQIDVNFDKYRWRFEDGDLSCQKNTDRGWHQSVRDLCECDARFARELAKIWDDDSFNKYFWLKPRDMRLKGKGKLDPDRDVFDFESTCVGGESGKAEQCCGTYPEKYPYNTVDKACCDNNTIYNFVTSVCCAGGHVASPGEC